MLLERYPSYSRQSVQSLVMQGKVTVDDLVITKAGTLIDPHALITIVDDQPKFVSRAGFKLEHALLSFGITVQGYVALDAGISTGGFTDCLLQHGVRKVYGVDVGYGQVHDTIRNNPHVILLERTNLRYVRDVGEPIDIITLDLSFISVLKVMDAVIALLKQHGILIVLIKPQFEAGRDAVGRGGIIKDAHVHEDVIKSITHAITAYGFTLEGVLESPITGAKGNKEFLAYFIKQRHSA